MTHMLCTCLKHTESPYFSVVIKTVAATLLVVRIANCRNPVDKMKLFQISCLFFILCSHLGANGQEKAGTVIPTASLSYLAV